MSEHLKRNKAQVVIVGAGFAGITAALKLVEKGLDVVVLEARERVGGRVFSIENELGIRIDLGSQWLGPSMKRIHQLIEQEGLTKVETFHKGKSVYSMAGKVKHGHGNLLPLSPTFLMDVLQFIHKINKRSKPIDTQAPWTSAGGKEMDAVSIGSFIEKNAYTQLGKAYWRVLISEAFCVEPNEVSLLDFLWGLRSNGTWANTSAAEQEWIKESAYSLIVKLANKLGQRIRLQSPVRSIQYDNRSAWITTDRGTWESEQVIVAVPPVLAGRITYTPPMPPKREKLTQNLPQGCVFKCVVTYARPFWRENGYSGVGYYDNGPVKATLDSSPSERPEGVMIALVSGEHARRFGQISMEQRREWVCSCLEKAFGSKARDALSYIDKDWSADEWSMGGYGAHFTPGVLSEYGDALYEPVGPIHWAGTETATEFRLYMEGAIQSGERAAAEVIRHFQK